MYERTIRPLHDWERAQIVMRMRPPKPERLSAWKRLAHSVAGESVFRTKLIEAKQLMIPKCREVLEDGQVVVHHVESAIMAVLTEWEDEGNLYFFDIGNGQLFCMWAGNDMLPKTEGGPWGNTDFKFAYTRTHSWNYWWIYCYGEELAPARVVRSQEFIEVPQGLGPGFTFDGTVSSCERDVKRFFGASFGADDEPDCRSPDGDG